MPEIDGSSLNAALLLDALVDLDARLEAIRRYLKKHPQVKNLADRWEFAHNMIGVTDSEILRYVSDQSSPRHIDRYVDAELSNRRSIVCYVVLDYGTFGWKLEYDIEVYREDSQRDVIGFPIVETERLDVIVNALQRAGEDLIEAVLALDLKSI